MQSVLGGSRRHGGPTGQVQSTSTGPNAAENRKPSCRDGPATEHTLIEQDYGDLQRYPKRRAANAWALHPGLLDCTCEGTEWPASPGCSKSTVEGQSSKAMPG